MRPYDQLTLAGQSRRLRNLAADALKAFGLRNPTFKLIQNWENATFRASLEKWRERCLPDIRARLN